MKKIILSLMAIIVAATAIGQAQADLSLMLKMQQVKKVKKINAKSPALAERISVLADVQESAIPEINCFAKVQAYAGGIAVIDLAISDLEQLCQTKGVKFVDSPKPVNQCMDKAREFGKVDKVHQGNDLPQGYDGKGITVGIVDQGFDLGHIAFSDAQGKSRLNAWIYKDTNTEKYVPITSSKEIISQETDKVGKNHGTHVASIATGRNMSNNYGGVAPGADIVLASYISYVSSISELTDEIMTATKTAIDYMKGMGQPFVLNASLGTYYGAHDGTEPVSRFFGALAKDNIMCFAVGNEGSRKFFMNHTFKQDENAYSGCLFSRNSLQFWSDDDTPFHFEMFICDSLTNERVPVFTIDGESEVMSVDNSDETLTGKRLKELFYNKKVSVSAQGVVKKQNNRYCVEVELSCDTLSRRKDCYLLFKMSGKEGQKLEGDMSDDANIFYDVEPLVKQGHITDGVPATLTNNGSLSVFCLNDDVISVGACSSIEIKDMIKPGQIPMFSSWYDSPYGYRRPHLVAPGVDIMAASNRYMNPAAKDTKYITVDGIEYPYVEMMGTSMAAPFVTGTVALWLQANPELKPQDVLRIINKTCVKNEYYDNVTNTACWGAGIIDAYAGIKEALSMPMSIVDNTSSSAIPLVKLLDNKSLEVTVAAGSPCNVKIYSPDGSLVKTASSNNNTLTIPVTTLSGIFIVNVNGMAIKMAM